MSKLDIIRDALRTIDGGTFQLLASHYVRNKRGICEFNNYGMSLGSTKPAPGTPDSFLVKPNGHLIFVECGTYNNYTKAIEKIRKDIDNCLEKERTSLSPNGYELDEIICCHNTNRIGPEKHAEFKTDIDQRVTLVGPDEIAEDCCSKYPWLASNYLGISTGKGIILDIRSFIKKNEEDNFTPSMKYELFDRDREVAELKELIQNCRAVAVTGNSGCGKTRICLEAAEMAAEHLGARVIVISSRKGSLYEDLSMYCSGSTPLILMLDDANELTDLATVIDYTLMRDNIRIVATIRSYAKRSALNELQRIKSYDEFVLTRPSSEEVAEIVRKSFKIGNARFTEHLGKIARGNLRLAFLVAESAQQESTSAKTVKELMESVYRNKLSALNEPTKKAMCVASLLGPHTTNDNHNLNALLSIVRLSIDEYLDACVRLHEIELMDMAGHYEAVSFEEQNLRDYYIYCALIDLNLITLSDLWALNYGRALCVNACQIVTDVFGDEKAISSIGEQAKALLDSLPTNEQLSVVESFGTILGNAGILAIHDFMDYKMNGVRPTYSFKAFSFSKNRTQGCLSNQVLSATARYLESPDNTKAALETLRKALYKINVSDADLEELFQRRLNESCLVLGHDYKFQNYVLDWLCTNALRPNNELEAICLVLFAKGLLKDSFTLTQPGIDTTITFSRYELRFSSQLEELRKRCIGYLAQLYNRPECKREIEDTILGYSGTASDFQLVQSTHATIRRDFLPVMNLNTYASCRSFAHYLRLSKKQTATNTLPIDLPLVDWPQERSPEDLRAVYPNAGEAASFEVINTSKAQLLAIMIASMLTDIFTNAEQSCNVLIPLARKFEEPDWDEFFELFNDGDEPSYDLPAIDELLTRLWSEKSLTSQIRNAITTGYIRSCLKPGSFANTCAEQFFDFRDINGGRDALLARVTHWRREWLAVYDEHAIRMGAAIDVEEVAERINAEGEILSFEAVCTAERLAPGSLTVYLDALISEAGTLKHKLQFYLPPSPKELDRMLNKIDLTKDNSLSIKNLVLELYCINQVGTLDSIVDRLIEQDLQLSKSLLKAFINGKSAQLPQHLLKKVICSEPFETLTDSLNVLLTDNNNTKFTIWSRQRSVLRDTLIEAYSNGRDKEADEWAIEASLNTSHQLCTLMRDTITSLPDEKRINLCVLLAKEGIEESVFEHIALSPGFEIISWTGSEIPLLKRQLEYFKKLESMLIDCNLWSYASIARKAVTAQQRTISQTKIREFTDPYLQHQC